MITAACSADLLVLRFGGTSVSIVLLLLVWNFLDEILAWTVARFVEYVVGKYVLAPEKYATYVERIMKAVVPHISLLVPLLRPLVGGSDTSLGKRVGDRIEVQYSFRDSVYIGVTQYTERPSILQAMATMDNNAILDVTERVRKYAGPCCDFSNGYVRPRDILRGCSTLVVRYTDNRVCSYATDTIIV